MTQSLILAQPVSGIGEILKTLTISPEGVRLKNELLDKADSQLAHPILSDIDRDAAKDIQAEIQTHLKAVERDHEAGKADFLKVCQAFDKVKREHIPELETKKTLLGRAIGAYESEKQRKLAEEQAELRRQAQKLEEERQAEARKAQAIIDGKASAAKKLAAALEQQERDEAAAEQQRTLATKSVELEASSGKATGGATRYVWEIELVDAKALYAARPECFKPLELKKSVVNGLLDAGIELPGIIARKVADFSARGL